jgi:hypothetical protein
MCAVAICVDGSLGIGSTPSGLKSKKYLFYEHFKEMNCFSHILPIK